MSQLPESEQSFLSKLISLVDGKTENQCSMYDVGDQLGLDREVAKKRAEQLIGEGYLEIRTLSGAVGLTEEGLAQAQGAGGEGATGQAVAGLGNTPVMSAEGAEAVAMVAATLKLEATELKLSFDEIAELVADLNTLTAQLNSPKPKTAIVKACLASIKNVLAQTNNSQTLPMIAGLLKE